MSWKCPLPLPVNFWKAPLLFTVTHTFGEPTLKMDPSITLICTMNAADTSLRINLKVYSRSLTLAISERGAPGSLRWLPRISYS